jgi:2-keto-4-pentenoate hydratase
MTPNTEAKEAAALLVQARASGTLLAGLPEPLVPRTAAAAYEIQQCVMAALGDIGGWKVGAPGPAAEPNCAPMPAAGIHRSPAVLPAADFAAPFIESEIAFLLAADLPAREAPYGAAEITAAIASCHPAIEIVQSRFADPDSAGPLVNLADLIRHGAFIYGDAVEGWQSIDFPALAVTQTIEGAAPRDGIGNPAGDMLRLLVWLANTGAAWAGGLRAGQIVTCGSWTGMTRATHGKIVTAFAGIAQVELRLTP